ncbi:MAG: nitrate/nitrite transporter NrtS [Acidobacteria bacterium]|nr:nitrate/nitrite transporter NrtS [Acidobacteriota bacterium]
MVALAIASSGPVIRGALKVALVVGTILNVINLRGQLTNGLSHLDCGKVCLNYAVPYCVATYSSTTAHIFEKRARSADGPQ